MLASSQALTNSGKRQRQTYSGMPQRIETTLPPEHDADEKTERSGDRDIGDDDRIGHDRTKRHDHLAHYQRGCASSRRAYEASVRNMAIQDV